MKKALLLAALILLTASVFAETDVTLSGDFRAKMGYEFVGKTYAEDYLDKGDYWNPDVDLNFTATVGEFTSLDFGINSEFDAALTTGKVSLTQDLTGALGVDGPVALSYTIGNKRFGVKDYAGKVTDIRLADTNDIDLRFDLGLMDMINIGLGFVPASYFNSAAELGATVYGVFGPVSAALGYTLVDGNNDLEVNSAIAIDPLTIGLQVQVLDLESNLDMNANVKVSAAIDAFSAGAYFRLDTAITALTYGFGADVAYDITEAVAASAYIDLTDSLATIEWGCEFDFGLDGATYMIGYDGSNAASHEVWVGVAGSF